MQDKIKITKRATFFEAQTKTANYFNDKLIAGTKTVNIRYNVKNYSTVDAKRGRGKQKLI